MEEKGRKEHWENIYETKELNTVSWYQPIPQTSLDFIEKSGISKNAKIIDVGGGDGFLVDHLLELGYLNITVLDISNAAIERAKKRLGEKSKSVNWIVSDVTLLDTIEQYDLWHDRAAFHFLTDKSDILTYVQHVKNYTSENAHLFIGTFSEAGPLKCSGIEITQYNSQSLPAVFKNDWNLEETISVVHPTPFNTKQDFIFTSFSKNG
jgi:2-polyprenyl-3-methyl-5-hydroxy-6-metoxy-1,4-benzoquinol methylase